MKVADLFRQLSYNELANLSMSGEGSGDIVDASGGRVIEQINSALLALHSRFTLIERELVVQTNEWLQMYPLHKVNAQTDPTPGFLKYIIDYPPDPFLGDVLNITGVRNEVGRRYSLNDDTDPLSVHTPMVDTIQVPYIGFNQAWFITYRANHPELIWNVDDITSTKAQDILVPLALENALRYKVAAGIFGSMSGQDWTNQTQALNALYETDCKLIETNGNVGSRSQSEITKLERRGFV